MKQPEKGKVSILIITYNRSALLKEAVDSLLNQTYKNIEIIVVDDGSTSVDTELYSKVDVYCYQKHGGIAKARNRALELMSGEYYFMFCDDDTLHPQALEKMVEAIEGGDIVFCHLKYFGETTGKFDAVKQNFKQCLSQKKMPGAGLFRKETLGHFRYNEIFKSACDYDYILNILSAYPQVGINILPVALYNYRIHNKQERGTHQENWAANRIREHYAKKVRDIH